MLYIRIGHVSDFQTFFFFKEINSFCLQWLLFCDFARKQRKTLMISSSTFEIHSFLCTQTHTQILSVSLLSLAPREKGQNKGNTQELFFTVRRMIESYKTMKLPRRGGHCCSRLGEVTGEPPSASPAAGAGGRLRSRPGPLAGHRQHSDTRTTLSATPDPRPFPCNGLLGAPRLCQALV